ncbi:MAG: hypothetical protein SFW36_05295 [Leptolyngbyaceae cyanobacterium bins.59]|nr:hypothetical protein [Leptolyngbyaceae cyanobacterium bins.59]
MVQPSPALVVEGGDASAIAQLMNSTLKPKGISSRAVLRSGCLYVRLDALQAPDQDLLSAFVQLSVLKLALQSIESLVIYGFQEGVNQPAWTQKIYLTQQLGKPGSHSVNHSSATLPLKTPSRLEISPILKLPTVVRPNRPKTRRIVQIINRQMMLKQVLTSALVAFVGIGLTTGLLVWLDAQDQRPGQWQRSHIHLNRWG